MTISAKSVPGVGTILVNGQGQTLYLLTSEQGGKITCTKASGCTKFWPETLLASGVTAAKAGGGVQASMLGTVTDASGNLEVTYNHWPLYTFVKDSGPGTGARPGAHGLRRHLVCPERIRQPRDQPCLLSGRRWPGGQGAAWAASRVGPGGEAGRIWPCGRPGGLLMAAGAIHLDLYLTGYRSIPVIGWLFLLQVIAAFGLSVGRPQNGRSCLIWR